MKKHTKLQVWKTTGLGMGKKSTTLVYCKKHRGNSHFSKEREHGGNEGINEHADHVKSGNPYAIEQKNMGGS